MKLHTAFCVLLIILFPFITHANQLPSQKKQVTFIENKGQFTGDSGTEILYVIKQPGLTIFIRTNGITYQFYEHPKKQIFSDDDASMTKSLVKNHRNMSSKVHRVDVNFLNSNADIDIITEGENPGYENYYSPAFQDGIKNVRTFNKITVANIYENIDWVLYENNGKLKYDLVVHPGGNIDEIKMQVNGASNIKLISGEEFNIQTKLGNIADAKLFCFEKESGKKNSVSFNLEKNIISFFSPAYNNENTLIIDPEITWSTFYGGEFEDAINSMQVAAGGYIYITGYTRSETGMAGLGFDNSYNGGFYDLYLVKLDTLGNRIWGTYYGGNGGDYGTGVTVNSTGEIYVTGFTFSENFPTSAGAFQETMNGNYDAVLCKFDQEGGRIWATCFGEGGFDYSRSVTVDNSQNIYIGGSSTSFSLGFGGYQNFNAGAADEMLVKFNPEGQRLWATYFGGPSDDFARAVAVDNENNVYLGGYTTSTTGIAYEGFDNLYSNNNDGTIAKFNITGERIWSTYYGIKGEDNVNGIAVDENNNIYVALQCGSKSGLGYNGYLNTGWGGMDAMLFKMDPAGNRIWSTYYGGTDEDMAKAVCVVDKSVYITGHSYSSFGIAWLGYQNDLTGLSDAFIAKFDTSGAFYWGSYAGGYDIEYGRAVSAYHQETIYMAGKTFSFTFPTSEDALQENFGGDPADGFIQKINDCADPQQYYFDFDGDGFGNTFFPIYSCGPVAGYAPYPDDCNDLQENVYPTNEEICNTYDDNCNGLIDDEDPLLIGGIIWYQDNDDDNYGSAITMESCEMPDGFSDSGNDCNDANENIFPGAPEVCNMLDDDCDGDIDDEIIFSTYFEDNDTDGYGDPMISITTCESMPEGFVENNNDCNDGNNLIFPGAIEICNALDDDCNFIIDDNVISATATALGPTTFCKGGNVLLEANSPGIATYQWKKGASNIAGANTQYYTANKSGNYSVVITVPGGCTATSPVVTVTVYNKPNPVISFLGSLDICATGFVKLKTALNAGNSYQWYKNGILIPGATNSIYTATLPGSYYVKEVNAFGCAKNSATVEVTNSCRNEIDGRNDLTSSLHIYPNPAVDNVIVDLELGSVTDEIACIQLYNGLGQLVLHSTHTVISGRLNAEIHLPGDFHTGIYFIHVSAGEHMYREMIMIEK